MALIEDIFAENVLGDPDDLEHVEEAEVFNQPDVDSDESNDDDDNEDKKLDADSGEIKKKRKISQKPRLNVLRLMSDKNGLTTIAKVFKDIKLKGKGYERDDLNLIMRKMEIWTHQLYPSMQFDDCLAKLEKLGTSRSVMTYVTKIRMGLEDDVSRMGDIIDEQDDSDNEIQQNSTVSDFDRLLKSQNQHNVNQTNNILGVSSGLSAEQRERMMRNRLIAEQRRLARMKARQVQQSAELAVVSTNCDSGVQAKSEEPIEMVLDKNINLGVLQDSSIQSGVSITNNTETQAVENATDSTVECFEENETGDINLGVLQDSSIQSGVSITSNTETQAVENATDSTVECFEENETEETVKTSNIHESLPREQTEDCQKYQDSNCGDSSILSNEDKLKTNTDIELVTPNHETFKTTD